MSINKGEQSATLILDMSRHHMIKWLVWITPSWHAFDIIWNIVSENLTTDVEGSVFQVSFIGKALVLAGIFKAIGRTYMQASASEQCIV